MIRSKAKDIIQYIDSSQSFSRVKATGLFGYRNLQSPKDLEKLSHAAVQQLETIVQTVTDPNAIDFLTVKRFDRLSDLLCLVVDTSEFIRNIHPDVNFVQAANKVHQDLSVFMSELNVNQSLYNRLKQVLEQRNWSDAELRVGQMFQSDFEKFGVHMSKEKRREFVNLNNRILEKGQQFLVNSKGCVNSFIDLNANLEIFKQLNPTFLKSFKINDKIRIPLPSPLSQYILTHSRDPDLRKLIYSEMHMNPKEHLENLKEMLIARSKLSRLLGKNSYAEMWLQDKMIRNPANAMKFIQSIHSKSFKKAKAKALEFEQTENSKFNEWDHAYFSSKIAPESEQMTASPGQTMQYLNDLLVNLFGIQLEIQEIAFGEVWHPSVRKFNLINESNQLLGTIYCDLFDRPTKMNGGAHFTVCCSRRVDDDSLDPELASMPKILETQTGSIQGKTFQIPVVVLSMNFTPGKLLDQSQIQTLFHEMGHAMHSMLGRTDFQHISGTRVPMDFVEVPSTLLELFAGSSKAPLEDIDHFQQVQLSITDQILHSELVSDNLDLDSVVRKIYKDYGLFEFPENATPYGSFGHLFTYGASYYSYDWSKIISNRLFQTYFTGPVEEWRQGGELISKELLSFGGSRDPWIGLHALKVVSSSEKDMNLLQ